MDRLVHVFGYYGSEASVLGWILEQSPSYSTNNFMRNLRWLNDPYNDPWDNHSRDELDWTHKWIYHQERGELEELNKIMTGPGVWGVSYGAWPQTKTKWKTPAVCILLEPNQRTFDYYWRCYAERPINDVQNSFDMHILDHHQNNPDYRKYMETKWGKYLEQPGIAFWKLQTCYHWGWTEYATDEDLPKAKAIAQNIEHTYHPDMMLDLFDLDLSKLCSKLEIEHTRFMDREYAMFLDYCTRTLKI